MRTKVVPFVLVVLAVLVALPLTVGRSTVQRVEDRTANPGAPRGLVGGGSEFLKGSFSCYPSPPSIGVQVEFGGTLPQSASDLAVGATHPIPDDACASIFESATSRVEELGCTAGPVFAGFPFPAFTFACHGSRDDMIKVMAVMSDGVLLGAF